MRQAESETIAAISLGTRYLRQRWQLIGSYTSMGATFQRVSGILTNSPERVGANLHLNYQPKRNLQLAFGHDNSAITDADREPGA